MACSGTAKNVSSECGYTNRRFDCATLNHGDGSSSSSETLVETRRVHDVTHPEDGGSIFLRDVDYHRSTNRKI
jgi:hypothetical protein